MIGIRGFVSMFSHIKTHVHYSAFWKKCGLLKEHVGCCLWIFIGVIDLRELSEFNLDFSLISIVIQSQNPQRVPHSDDPYSRRVITAIMVGIILVGRWWSVLVVTWGWWWRLRSSLMVVRTGLHNIFVLHQKSIIYHKNEHYK